MPNYRELTSTNLLSEATCAACETEECGVSTAIPSGDEGYYELDFDTGGEATDTGAIMVYFNPSSIPDGIRVFYDGAYYTTLSNSASGKFSTTNTPTASSGFTVIGGATEASCLTPKFGASISYPYFKGIANGAWVRVTDTNGNVENRSITIDANDYMGSDIGERIWSALVIPKPNSASPRICSIQALGPCDQTGWGVYVTCPAELPSVQASIAQTTGACSSNLTQDVYFTLNANPMSGSLAFPGQANNTVPVIGNFVFTDANGTTPLNPTSTVKYYATTGNTAFSVLNGVVVSSGPCT